MYFYLFMFIFIYLFSFIHLFSFISLLSFCFFVTDVYEIIYPVNFFFQSMKICSQFFCNEKFLIENDFFFFLL